MSKKNRKVKKSIDYFNIEVEVKKYNYQPLTILAAGDHQFIKVLNEKGQKLYLLIDELLNIKADLTLTLNNDTLTDYSQKANALKIAELESYGLIFEQPEGLCYIYNTVEEKEDNLVVKEENYLLNEKVDTDLLCYPIFKLSEVKTDNNLVLSGTDNIVRHLRNDAYASYYKQLTNLRQSIINLNEDYNDLLKLINFKTSKVKQIDNLISKNEAIDKLICGMSKISNLRLQIDNIDQLINDYIDFYT